MKTTIKYLVAAVLATIAIVSCKKNETEAPAFQETHFILKASSTEAKTGIYYDQGSYLPYFQQGDEIGLFVNSLPTKASDLTVDASFANTADDGDDATFEGTLEVAAGDVTFYSFYPASAGKKVYKNDETITLGLDVPSTQHPAYDASFGYSFDPKADILIAKPANTTVDASHNAAVADIYFARLTAVLRVAINAESSSSDVYGERVKSLKIETSAGNIAGRIVVNPLTGECTGVNEVGGSKVIEAIIDDPDDCATYIGYDDANNVFLGVAPITIPQGSNVTFTINTVDASGKASHKIVKEVLDLGAAIVFECSKPTVINLTVYDSEIGDADEEDTTDYSGEWVIAGTDTEDYVMSQFVSGNVYPAVEAASINTTTEVVTVVGSKTPYKMTIAKITEGANAGLYTIKDAGNNYLTATASDANKNYLAGVETPVAGSYWNISKKEGVLKIIAANVDESYAREIRVNRNLQSNVPNPRFSCYKASSTLPKVNLYPYSKVVESLSPAATPVISCENNTITITCTTVGATIYYELGTTESNTNDPTTSSTVYNSSSKPTISTNAYIKAIAVAEGYTTSAVAGQALTYQDANTSYYVKVVEAPSDWTGDYLIVYENGNSSKVLAGVSSNIGQQVAVTITNSKIVADDYSSYNVEIAAGTTSGKYTMKMGSVYLAYTSTATSGSNYLYTVDSATANGAEWTLSVDDARNVYNTSRYLRYNTSSPRFCCYTSGQSKISFYKLEDNDTRTPVTLSFSPASPTAITFGDTFTEPTLTKDPAAAPVVYSVETTPANIATIDDSTGDLTITGAGTITVTATVSDVTTYKPNSESYTLVVNKATPTITAFTDSEVEVAVNGSVTKTTTINPNTLAIVYTTSDDTIASINSSTGQVTGLKDGYVTISATFAGNANYNAATAQTYSLKVGTGGTSILKGSTVTSTFTNKDLAISESNGMTWTASKSAYAFESSSPARGVQFGAAIGAFTLTGTGYSSGVQTITMVVSTNGTANVNTISVKVNGVDLGSTESLPKENNQTITFSSATVLAGGDIVISVNDSNKSVYFKSITIN